MFSKICISWENYDCIEKKIKFLMAALDAQQDFMSMKFNFLSLLNQKIRVFMKSLPKLNILSVIAINLVKIFKQTKNHSAHYIKVYQLFLEKNNH